MIFSGRHLMSNQPWFKSTEREGVWRWGCELCGNKGQSVEANTHGAEYRFEQEGDEGYRPFNPETDSPMMATMVRCSGHPEWVSSLRIPNIQYERTAVDFDCPHCGEGYHTSPENAKKTQRKMLESCIGECALRAQHKRDHHP